MNSVTTRATRKQKIVLQSIAFVILGVVFVPMWAMLEATRAANMQAAAVATLPNALPTLFNGLYIVLFISLLAILLGILCAFYLEEWLLKTNSARRLLESIIAILTGLPSLLYGILAIGVSCSYAGIPKVLGDRTFLHQSAGAIPFQRNTMLFYAEVFTFILMVMPLTIKTTQEALRSVATPIREAVYALGASKWQVLKQHVMPLAFTRILAGGCQAMARAFATAALLIGIYTWHYTTEQGELSNRFGLFLTMALFLSVLSSTLIKMDNSDAAQLTEA